MRYSIDAKDRRYVKNIGKNMSNKYRQKLVDNAKSLQQMQ